VTSFPVFDVPVSIGGGSPVLYEVPEDKELQEMIIDACADFWQRVVDGRPPEPVNYADAVQRFGKSEAQGIIQASDAEIQLVTELKAVRSYISEYETKEEEIKAKLIIALGETGDTLTGTFSQPLITYKLGKGRKSFDVKTFERDHPELYRGYLRTGEAQRRFLLK
jgi:predicted phage-related endonuclease